MSRTIAIAMAIAASGCRERAEPPRAVPSASPVTVSTAAPVTPEERKSAEDIAVAYLAAMSAKDCTTLLGIVSAYKAADCKEDTNEWVEHKTTLIAIDSIARDGRDPTAFLVTTKMNVGGSDRHMIVRVVHAGSDWKVHK